jgi:hypothetical protein
MALTRRGFELPKILFCPRFEVGMPVIARVFKLCKTLNGIILNLVLISIMITINGVRPSYLTQSIARRKRT